MLDFFYFHDYSIEQLDALNYIWVYVVALVLTYYGWRVNLEYDKPYLVNFIIIVFIIFLIYWETLVLSYPKLALKIAFCLISCQFLKLILNKIFNSRI